jgi:glycosyltransferase involved in cell wall biosynthesis
MTADHLNHQFVFGNVTLLVTHYNRSGSLKRLLQSFDQLNVQFGEIIVSDDGSAKDHLDQIMELQQTISFKLITTPINKGLSNNINKGQDAIKTPYTLYVQEDFVPTEAFPLKFQESLEIMDDRKDIDLVRYWAFGKYPYLKALRNGFSEMDFNIWKPGYYKFYVYSDACHLRRSTFFNKFGRYIENGVKSDRAEYLMMMNFLRKKGVAIYYDNCRELFDHQNDEHEPSTVKRNYLGTTHNYFISILRDIYRNIKFNLDYLMLFTWHWEKLVKRNNNFLKISPPTRSYSQ